MLYFYKTVKGNKMRRYWQYFKYVMRHKLFVFRAGRKLHVPLFTLVFHDWDKFLPDEWFPYARTFYKPNGEKQYDAGYEFAHAWMLHQHRNKHHWQYWLNAEHRVDIRRVDHGKD